MTSYQGGGTSVLMLGRMLVRTQKSTNPPTRFDSCMFLRTPPSRGYRRQSGGTPGGTKCFSKMIAIASMRPTANDLTPVLPIEVRNRGQFRGLKQGQHDPTGSEYRVRIENRSTKNRHSHRGASLELESSLRNSSHKTGSIPGYPTKNEG